MKKYLSYESTPQLATIKLLAMGCHIQISLNTVALSRQYSQSVIDQQVALLAGDVQQKLAYWESIFSRFDDTSELMRLNNHTNQWSNVKVELFEVLQRAMHFVSKTQGLVTPTLLKSMWKAGYKHSFETLSKISIPSTTVINTNVASTITKNINLNGQDVFIASHSKLTNANQHIKCIQLRILDSEQHQIYLPTGIALDLNGYVKGWCAMQLAEQISNAYDCCFACLVDMGGDIAVGVPSDHDINHPIIWGIAVAKPHLTNGKQVKDEEDVAILAIKSGAIATSGQDYRRWWHEGQWQHHLIHPHYFRPANSDVLTATVLATDTLTAEVYAKYCVLLGIKEAMAWLRENHIAAILIDTDNKVLASPAIHSNLVQPNLMVV